MNERTQMACSAAVVKRIPQLNRFTDLQINVKENTLGIRDLTARVEALQRLEDRVAALERRGS